MNDPTSLDQLRDIVVPNAPAFWPPAPALWWLLAIVVMVMVIYFSRRRARQLRNAYRHNALELLDQASTLYDISVILKRTALAAFPREQVASLYGEDWASFLRKTGGRRDFTPLTQGPPDAPASKETRRLAAHWIKRHKLQLTTPGGQ